jgi:hypothetical protein
MDQGKNHRRQICLYSTDDKTLEGRRDKPAEIPKDQFPIPKEETTPGAAVSRFGDWDFLGI